MPHPGYDFATESATKHWTSVGAIATPDGHDAATPFLTRLHMTATIDLTSVEDPQDAVHAAVRTLCEGGVVAMPDECGLIICGLSSHSEAVRRLTELRPHWKTAIPAVSLPYTELIDDYIVESPPAQKLANRLLPGPVILQLQLSPEKLSSAWSADAARWFHADSEQGWNFAVPAEETQQSILRLLPAPLLTLTVPTHGVAPTSPVGGVDLTLLGGTPRYGECPTLIRVQGNEWDTLREGVLSDRMIQHQLCDVFLFVCTGNTCRSPMAEGLFRNRIAARMQCSEEELVERGIIVVSAGLAAYPGSPASREAVQLLKAENNIDLRDHASQPVTEELLFRSDLIITMTAAHREAIINTFPDLSSKTRLLSPDGNDVSDPMGAGMEEYQRCRDEIQDYVDQLIIELDANS